MSAPPSHDRLVHRHSVSGIVVCGAAVHVGTSAIGGALSASDMPVIRDGLGRPFLPGASLRGALRSRLEALLRGLSRSGQRVCDPLLTEPTNEERSCSERVKEARKGGGERRNITEQEAFQLAWDNSCEVCRFFGSSFLASRLRIADLPLASEPEASPVYVRNGVGLDRDLRTASRRILYSFEAVSGGAQFDLRMEVENAASHEMGLLLIGLNLFGDGLATIGGKSARGLGQAEVKNLVVTRKTAEDFFQGGLGQELSPDDLQDFRKAARAHYLEGN